MPIAKLTPTAKNNITPNITKIQPPSFKSVVIDEKLIPRSNLLGYISGSTWTVDYFQQVLGEDNDLKEFDVAQGRTVQQYNLIHKLELRVDSELSSSMDSDKAMTIITGSATIYPFLIPNVGDVFIAECGKGRIGMFSITEVERKTFNRESVFSINYTCLFFLDEDKDKFKNLHAKVIREYVFNKDRLMQGGVPVLTTEEDNQYVRLVSEYKSIIRYYCKYFFNDEINSFSIPGQLAIAYDSFVNEFIMKIINVEDYGKLYKTTMHNIEHDEYLEQDQLYSVLLERDYDLLFRCNKFMTLSSTNTFNNDATIQTLKYSKIGYIVYPKIIDKTYTKDISRLGGRHDFQEVESGCSDIKVLLGTDDITYPSAIIKPITYDDYYVFSEEFYRDLPGQSILEELTLEYLKCKALNIDKLMKVCKEYRSWGRLEQFYYIPILLLLIKSLKINLY